MIPRPLGPSARATTTPLTRFATSVSPEKTYVVMPGADEAARKEPLAQTGGELVLGRNAGRVRRGVAHLIRGHRHTLCGGAVGARRLSARHVLGNVDRRAGVGVAPRC